MRGGSRLTRRCSRTGASVAALPRAPAAERHIVGRTPRSLRSLSRPPLNGSIVGRTTSNMPIKIGEVEALFRYPVKSMAAKLSRSPTWAGTVLMATGAWPSVGLTIAAVSPG